MNLRKALGTRWKLCIASGILGCGILSAAGPEDEIRRLKAQLQEQQKQIQALQVSITAQQEMLDRALATVAAPQPARLGEVASTTPMLPAVAPLAPPALMPPAQGAPTAANGNPCEAGVDANAIPPYLRVGNTCIQPVGFMDFTAVMRDKNPGSGIGSNFGSVPLSNALAGNLGETKFSTQNSRLGFRMDSNYKGAHVIGYLEFDFLGTPSGTNLEVTNGAFTPRMRLFWADVRKDKWEILGGQSWSMLTPNRKSLSAIPGDIFYTQAIDVNYVNGLTWDRQPQFRAIYHPNANATFGVSFEQPEMYVGGSAGGSTITAPTALTALLGTQLNSGATNIATPTKVPDTVVKLALDTSNNGVDGNPKGHFEIGGVIRGYRLANPVSSFQTSSAVGGGGSVNFSYELAKGMRLVSNNFISEGGGRYLFGQAPDLIVTYDGVKPGISLLKTKSTLSGLEYTYNFQSDAAKVSGRALLLYAYYGGMYTGRDTTIDPATGRLVGYGQAGGSVNRSIQEFTLGFNQTLYKNARYGAFNLMGQYEYLKRSLWAAAVGTPGTASDNTVYVNLRYTLPGSMPKF